MNRGPGTAIVPLSAGLRRELVAGGWAWEIGFGEGWSPTHGVSDGGLAQGEALGRVNTLIAKLQMNARA